MSHEILVFAGPNGSGKSTIQKHWQSGGKYINADEIQVELGCSNLEAAQEAERQREACLARGESFTFETVLSTQRNLKLLKRAREQGYRITSVFVLTRFPRLNVHRVAARVAAGGHPVPEEKTVSRYQRALANLTELNALSDSLLVIDNTKNPIVIYARDSDGEQILPNDFWSDADIRKLLGEFETTSY